MAAARLAPPIQLMPPPTTFAELALDLTNDHFVDHYPELMSAFNIGATPPTPAEVRYLVAEATAQRKAE